MGRRIKSEITRNCNGNCLFIVILFALSYSKEQESFIGTVFKHTLITVNMPQSGTKFGEIMQNFEIILV